MKKLGNKGFSLIEGLLILIALTLVIGVGYYVYNSNKQADKNLTVSSSTTKPKSSIDNKKYLEIKELGIKFELNDKLKNAYYKVDHQGYIYLSVHDLDGLKGFEGCTAGAGAGQDGIAAIDYAKVGDDHFGSPWTEADLENFTQSKIGSTHYWIEPRSQAPCYDPDMISQDDPNVVLLGTFKNSFYEQGKTITKL